MSRSRVHRKKRIVKSMFLIRDPKGPGGHCGMVLEGTSKEIVQTIFDLFDNPGTAGNLRPGRTQRQKLSPRAVARRGKGERLGPAS